MAQNKKDTKMRINLLSFIGLIMLIYSLLLLKFGGIIQDVINYIFSVDNDISYSIVNFMQMLVLFIIPVAFIIVYKVYRLRRSIQDTAQELLSKDSRPPILLLRPFGMDNRMHVPVSINNKEYYHIEQVLYSQLSKIGPVIAIGKPGERLQPLGASRFYISSKSWQEEVDDLLKKSSLIVVIMDFTPGIRWEIDRVLNVFRFKTLFIPKILVTKRGWTLHILSHLPASGILINKWTEPFFLAIPPCSKKFRGEYWYACWNDFKNKYSFLPPLTDRSTCFYFDRNDNAEVYENIFLDASEQYNNIFEGIFKVSEQ